MTQPASVAEPHVKPLDSRFVWRVFFAFGALAMLSLAISIGGKWVGKSIVLAGHTDDQTPREIVIGNNVIGNDGAKKSDLHAGLDRPGAIRHESPLESRGDS